MHTFDTRKHYPAGQFHLNNTIYSFQINPVKPYALPPIPSTDKTLTVIKLPCYLANNININKFPIKNSLYIMYENYK